MGDHTAEFVVELELSKGYITLDQAEIRKLYFIEDIFSYCMTGKLTISSHRGITEFGPLTGNERVRIVYGNEVHREVNFRIYKINKVDQVMPSTPSQEVIDILFTEETFFLFNFFKYSKSWQDKKATEIITDIATHHLEIDNWDKKEESIERFDFCMPYWTPNQAFNWLLKRGTGILTNQPGFLFFNNTRGANLVTLEHLLSVVFHTPLTVGDNIYSFLTENEVSYNKILYTNISGIDHSAYKYLSGGVMRGYDTKRKKFLEEDYKYMSSVKKQTILGRKTLYPEIDNLRVNYYNTMEDEEKMIDTIYYNAFHKKYVHGLMTSITCRGHEDRYCGGMIELDWPSGDVKEWTNKNLNNYYLVKSITHSFNANATPAYKQKMVLIKNGYTDSDVDELISASKINISMG